MTTGDLYNLLGISASATPDEIRAAYHQAARRADRSGRGIAAGANGRRPGGRCQSRSPAALARFNAFRWRFRAWACFRLRFTEGFS